MRRMILGACCLLLATAAQADETPVSAAAVRSLGDAAARAWADDAQLVYLENDTPFDAGGRAARWGLLYYSDARQQARGYSVREGEVERAKDLGFEFAAPALGSGWIDSDVAWSRAEEAGGARFRAEHAGHLRSALLTRGLMHLDDPQRTTWTFVYDAPGQPSLWVVLDAADGKVLRRWKG